MDSPSSSNTHDDKASCPPQYLCPLSGVLMTNPVILNANGRTFESSALNHALKILPGHDPLSRGEIIDEKLTINQQLQEETDNYINQNIRVKIKHAQIEENNSTNSLQPVTSNVKTMPNESQLTREKIVAQELLQIQLGLESLYYQSLAEGNVKRRHLDKLYDFLVQETVDLSGPPSQWIFFDTRHVHYILIIDSYSSMNCHQQVSGPSSIGDYAPKMWGQDKESKESNSNHSNAWIAKFVNSILHDPKQRNSQTHHSPHRHEGGSTALHISVQNNNIGTTEILVKHGANIELRNGNNCTSLTVACRYGSFDCAKLLCEVGANLRCVRKSDICCDANTDDQELKKRLISMLNSYRKAAGMSPLR